ncbi:LCP family protein [Patescibacteria group bacterium]
MWKFIVIFLLVISLGTLGYILFKTNNDLQKAGIETGVTLSPFSKKEEMEEEMSEITQGFPLGNPINIMLLGIDRRSRYELGYRTDIMILVSVNPDTNNVVLASLPRDLWYQGSKINGLFNAQGWEAMQNATEEVFGMRPERFILTDFKDFSWIVDAMGGVPVDVDRTFTDSNYPVDATKGYQTVTFTQGQEVLTGSRALIYSRSRKGNNGEGSDWMRMRRQHKILVGMSEGVLQPKSIFNPMVVEKALKTVTEGRMDTNIQLADAKYLWDFYKDKDKYTIHSLFLDYEYLYSPPAEQYGGAWTIVPKDGSYQTFQNKVQDRLLGVVEDETADLVEVLETD